MDCFSLIYRSSPVIAACLDVYNKTQTQTPHTRNERAAAHERRAGQKETRQTFKSTGERRRQN
jgi:hypothetical protein